MNKENEKEVVLDFSEEEGKKKRRQKFDALNRLMREGKIKLEDLKKGGKENANKG